MAWLLILRVVIIAWNAVLTIWVQRLHQGIGAGADTVTSQGGVTLLDAKRLSRTRTKIGLNADTCTDCLVPGHPRGTLILAYIIVVIVRSALDAVKSPNPIFIGQGVSLFCYRDAKSGWRYRQFSLVQWVWFQAKVSTVVYNNLCSFPDAEAPRRVVGIAAIGRIIEKRWSQGVTGLLG